MPAAGRPMFAAVPVPRWITPCRAEVTRLASFGWSARTAFGAAGPSDFPVGVFTDMRDLALRCRPCAASVA